MRRRLSRKQSMVLVGPKQASPVAEADPEPVSGGLAAFGAPRGTR
jgi:hypothetical protein